MTLFLGCLSLARTSPSDLCTEFTAGCSIQKKSIQGPRDVEDQYLLDVTLGKLSEVQYGDLQTRYKAIKTSPYDATKIYKLVDFLPAFIQKSNGKRLIPHSVPAAPKLVKALRDQKIETANIALVDANCHSVTWQWINFLQGQGTEDILLSLADGDALNLEFRVDAKDLQAGDVLVIQGTGGFGQIGAVLHSAIYLGHGLLFEKPNPGKE
jgi:hypothetical protein